MHKDQPPSQPAASTPVPRPAPSAVNEAGSIHVSGYIRVFDPNTQETLVEARE